MLPITKHTSTIDTSSAPGRKIEYIVIHYTAGTNSRKGAAINAAEWWKLPNTEASADFIVDDETIVRYNPDVNNRYCWHVGGSKYKTKGGSLYGKATNYNSVGIEICSTSSTGSKSLDANAVGWTFTDAALNNALDLTRYLMTLYGIDADHVIRHYDVTGKLCPGIVGWNEDSGDVSKWLAFKAKLEPEKVDPELEAFKRLFEAYRKELKDNDAASYSKEAREWAVENGIVAGGDPSTFNGMWEDFVTREQMATFLFRFANALANKSK